MLFGGLSAFLLQACIMKMMKAAAKKAPALFRIVHSIFTNDNSIACGEGFIKIYIDLVLNRYGVCTAIGVMDHPGNPG
jgi:hypothetical protein